MNTKSNLIIRLDARSHITNTYISDLVNLSINKKVANVGGYQNPIGKTRNQKHIACIMKHPLCFGGGKHRKNNFEGYVDSVYLGAFNRELMPPEPWFDEKFVKISEDSELNFRIRKNGGFVFLSSKIKVDHFPRENIKSFLKLCYNYGVGRGFFYLKHKTFSAYRQLVLPGSVLISLLLLGLWFVDPIFLNLFMLLFFSYIIIILYSALSLYYTKKLNIIKSFCCFIFAHFFWTLGFFNAFFLRIINSDT